MTLGSWETGGQERQVRKDREVRGDMQETGDQWRLEGQGR